MKIPVVCCVDHDALLGLHVTLRSALSHLSEGAALHVHLLQYQLDGSEIELLNETLASTGRPFEIFAKPCDPSQFAQMRWLGGWMTYLRLLAPELVSLDRLIYLDADLIVHADLRELFECDFEGQTIGAATWNSFAESNDRKFFEKLGFDLSAPYFNAGVLLIDAAKWRRDGISKRCIEIGNRFRRQLPTADQTILNQLFFNSFARVPRRFNTPVSADRQPLGAEQWRNRIVHLLGRPKPWEPAGFLNGQSRVFHEELSRTAKKNSRGYSISLETARRCLRLSKPYLKCIRARLRPMNLHPATLQKDVPS